MMKRAIFLGVTLLLLAAGAFAQIDPKGQQPTKLLDSVTATTTSSPYAVTQLVANETILFQIDTPDAAVGTFELEGTLDNEASVKADTAKWWTIYTTTSFNAILFLEDSPPYVRVRWTKTSGTFRCLMRASGARFREVLP